MKMKPFSKAWNARYNVLAARSNRYHFRKKNPLTIEEELEFSKMISQQLNTVSKRRSKNPEC